MKGEEDRTALSGIVGSHPEEPATESWSHLAAVYMLYLAATVVLTWPVAARLGREIPGLIGDPEVYLWNIWWLKFSVLGLHRNPLWCDWILWPFGGSFAFHTHTILYSAIAVALLALHLNPAASLGLLFLNSFALTGLGTYLWCREFGARRTGAFVGGFVVAFCYYRLGRGICHYNLLATELLPFFWLALKRGVERERVRSYVAAGLLAVMIFWQEAQMFFFAACFAAIYLGAAILRRPQQLVRATFWRGMALLAAIVFVGSLPYLVAVVPLAVRGEYMLREGGPALQADLLSFFVPWPYHTIFGRWTKGLYDKFRYGYIESTGYIGYVALFLGLAGFSAAQKQGRRVAWLAVALVVFIILSLGERLEVGGSPIFTWHGKDYSIILPGAALYNIPLLRQFRVFSRFMILVMFALSVPVAWGTDDMVGRLRRRSVRGLLAVAILLLISLEVAMLPYQTHGYFLSRYAPFSLVLRIRDDPQMVTVLTVPPTIHQAQEQYMQVFHSKPIFGGELSRMPKYVVRHMYSLPVIRDFFWERQEFINEEAAARALTGEYVDRFLDMHNIKYLLLAPGPRQRLVQRLVESRFPVLGRWKEKNFVLYELERPRADRPLNIDFRRHWSALYLGRGFWPPSDLGSWAVEREAELWLPIRGSFWKAVVIEMTPFVFDDTVQQTVELELNGQRIGRVALKPQLAYYQFSIPTGALDGRPCSRLRFRFAYCESPWEKGISSDRRRLAAAVRRLHVLSEPRDDLPLVNP